MTFFNAIMQLDVLAVFWKLAWRLLDCCCSNVVHENNFSWHSFSITYFNSNWKYLKTTFVVFPVDNLDSSEKPGELQLWQGCPRRQFWSQRIKCFHLVLRLWPESTSVWRVNMEVSAIRESNCSGSPASAVSRLVLRPSSYPLSLSRETGSVLLLSTRTLVFSSIWNDFLFSHWEQRS